VVVPAPERGGCWRLLAVGLMSALAGAVLSLAILLIINGTLNFQTSTRQVLKAEVARLDGEIGTLNNGLTGLQSRLESMEDLATELDEAQADIRRLADDLTIMHGTLERLAGDLDDTQVALGSLAGDVEELEENVVALQTQFSTVEDQLNTLSGELDSVREAADRFEGFLDGLRSLLGQTAKPTVEDSPFNLESPPLTSVPPTRQPVFTVIPLATPTPIP
jgi:prefoldin subunit 5